jgi:hypothetical protein
MACSVELAGTGPVLIVDAGVVPSGPGPGGGIGPQGEDAHQAGGGSDASVDMPPDRDADVPSYPSDADANAPGCALDGRYAVRVAFDVSWVGTEFFSVVPIVMNGDGELSFVVLMELQTKSPGQLDARFRTCAAVVPEFVATISGEHYQARFDSAVWDAPTMPVFTSTLKTSCLEAGCTLKGDPTYALIGSALSPASATWPATAAAGSWPDHDGDGNPGVAAYMLGPSDGQYAYPPVDIFSSRRARDLMLGLRVVLGIDGVLDSCDEAHGATPQGSIHSRAVGCESGTRPTRCTASELSFLNDNLPAWTVRKGQFHSKRVSAEADCKEARRVFVQ